MISKVLFFAITTSSSSSSIIIIIILITGFYLALPDFITLAASSKVFLGFFIHLV
jgi:hypothetical protein